MKSYKCTADRGRETQKCDVSIEDSLIETMVWFIESPLPLPHPITIHSICIKTQILRISRVKGEAFMNVAGACVCCFQPIWQNKSSQIGTGSLILEGFVNGKLRVKYRV